MKKILVIGDSHTSKIGNCVPDVFFLKNRKLEYQYSEQNYVTHIVEEGRDIWLKDYLKTHEDKELQLWMSSHPGRSALNFDFENFASGTQKRQLDDWNEEGRIVVPWLGYIDIRNWLPQTDLPGYLGAKEVVSRYIDNVLNKFDKCEVIFMEPLPQFICFITNGWVENRSDPDIEFERRHEQHLLFIDELKKQCKERGLREPINTREILGNDMIEPYKQPKKPINVLLNDHMKQEYYDPIVEYLATKLSIDDIE
jgi:hypothetical protein